MGDVEWPCAFCCILSVFVICLCIFSGLFYWRVNPYTPQDKCLWFYTRTRLVTLALNELVGVWFVTSGQRLGHGWWRHRYGNQFTAYTDNNPLTYVLTTAKLDAMGHRWVAALSQHNFDIVYRTGSSNRDADALSRIRWPQKLKEIVPQAVVQAMCQYLTSDESLVESVAIDDAVLPDQWDSSPLDLSVDWKKGASSWSSVGSDHSVSGEWNTMALRSWAQPGM